jgi:hypothetical protein
MNEVRLIKLLSELTKLTSQGKLNWHRTDTPDHYTAGTSHVFPDYYEARFKEQKIGIGLQRYSEYDGDRDRFFWNERLYFLLLNSMDEVIWHKEGFLPAMSVLFDTVRDKVANVDGLIDSLLNDGAEEEEEL